MLNTKIFIEEGKAVISVEFGHVVCKFVAAREESVEFIVTESDTSVISDGAAIVDVADVGPEGGTEAHVAGLTSCVKVAVGEVERVEVVAGFSDGVDLAVAGWVVVLEDAVVAFADNLPVFNDNGAEGSAVMFGDAVSGFCYGELHEIVMGHIGLSVKSQERGGI